MNFWPTRPVLKQMYANNSTLKLFHQKRYNLKGATICLIVKLFLTLAVMGPCFPRVYLLAMHKFE